MEKNEAEIVARIMLTADGGCLYCACALIDQLASAFPSHKDIMQSVISEECEHIIGEVKTVCNYCTK